MAESSSQGMAKACCVVCVVDSQTDPNYFSVSLAHDRVCMCMESLKGSLKNIRDFEKLSIFNLLVGIDRDILYIFCK